MNASERPIIREHEGIAVVRDDLFSGGTKARYLPALFHDADEIVYASPAEGAAQTALAITARRLGKRATIFVAKRAQPHARALMAKRHGAKVYQVSPGYLSVVSARARAYAEKTGSLLAPFGVDLPETIQTIAAAARASGVQPDEVWCAAGSGTLARGLAAAWPNARRHVVQVGKKLEANDVAGATIHVAQQKFEKASKAAVPFPSDPHYDAKAWEICKARRGAGLVLFWNVTSPATID
ncbi:MAG TPA: pyridoxal-phosphate dependent enzyme [Methylosinus sp.]|jgi:threonine dehydratase|uniref:pyridoxal-phosphate dependent enzyme n=1 Tax=Methylosinus sp. TaxID=427 RepID=UPI002F943109